MAKITLNELKSLIKRIIIEQSTTLSENDQEESMLAKKYLDDMIKRHGDHKSVRKNILSNLVNSKYSRATDSFITKVWAEFNKRFPS